MGRGGGLRQAKSASPHHLAIEFPSFRLWSIDSNRGHRGEVQARVRVVAKLDNSQRGKRLVGGRCPSAPLIGGSSPPQSLAQQHNPGRRGSARRPGRSVVIDRLPRKLATQLMSPAKDGWETHEIRGMGEAVRVGSGVGRSVAAGSRRLEEGAFCPQPARRAREMGNRSLNLSSTAAPSVSMALQPAVKQEL